MDKSSIFLPILCQEASGATGSSRASFIVDHADVGICGHETGYALKVNLRTPASIDLPQVMEGIPVQYEVVGDIRLL
jgi:hypothetical protein